MTDTTEEPPAKLKSGDVISVGINAFYSYGEPLDVRGIAFQPVHHVTIHDPAATSWKVFAYNETQDFHYFLKEYKRKAPALKMVERLGRHFGIEPVIDYILKWRPPK